MLNTSSILGRRILMLTAHPDDESFLAAGTIFANNQAGGQTFLVCATLGEKGASHLKEPTTEEQLKVIRYKELKTVCGLLNIQRVYELGLPDGGVDNHKSELRHRISPILDFLRPNLIMSFGSDGITGHKDHIAVNEVARQIALEHQLPIAEFCIPKKVSKDAYEWLLKRRRAHSHYHNDLSLAEENIAINIDPQIKIKALKYYASQIDEGNPFAGFPKEIANTLLHTECFNYISAES